MLPIKDTIRSRSFPLVNWLLIAANTVVWFLEIGLSQSRIEQVIYTFGIVPAQLDFTNPLTWLPLFTHMFLHGGWVHFLSNVWILFIFGDNVEDRLGSFGYLIFYLVGGLAAGLLQTVINLSSTVPAIGASGAIAAVMGAYFVFFPRARVITLIPIFFFWFAEIPAILYLGIWFVTQLFSGVASLTPVAGEAASGGVAFWAHIGGFVFGVLIALLLKARQRAPRTYPDQYFPW